MPLDEQESYYGCGWMSFQSVHAAFLTLLWSIRCWLDGFVRPWRGVFDSNQTEVIGFGETCSGEDFHMSGLQSIICRRCINFEHNVKSTQQHSQ